MPGEVDRELYGTLYGPTVGDRIRLGDTSILVEIERDETSYGDEVLAGCGKTTQAGMLVQSRPGSASMLDLVISNVVIMDPLLGVFKGNIGIKDGRIVGIGRAGNPDVMDNVDLVIGPHTSLLPGEGMIATPGGVDSHVHLSSPAVLPVLLGSGITTIVGMGSGGVWDVGVNPRAHLQGMLEAWRAIPLNVAFLARGAYDPSALEQALSAGASGLKIHEDFGGSPSIVDCCLTVAEEFDVAVAMHTDSLNESGSLADSLDALDGRTVHAYHVEGSGGGHVPNSIELVSQPHVLASSTTPTVPFGVNALDEIVPMAMIVHHQNAAVASDVAATRSRVRARTMEAESWLHEQGAISIINSDSLGMGRGGEVIRRTWQLADVMGREVAAEGQQNERVRRYLAKYTINPAITHGLSSQVGSLEPGKLADLVLWRPEFFGTKPEMVVKRGFIAWGASGDGSSSIRRGQPRMYGPMFGGLGDAPGRLATVFVSQAAAVAGISDGLPGRHVEAVRNTRRLTRAQMVANNSVPKVEVPDDDGPVLIEGRPARLAPVTEVPLGQRYHFA
ncbi:MAG: urease subunit alpha [Acidimicrobiia bacterium]|nr:urease subunit alpha [Acidimicrobiia bacterium]